MEKLGKKHKKPAGAGLSYSFQLPCIYQGHARSLEPSGHRVHYPPTPNDSAGEMACEGEIPGFPDPGTPGCPDSWIPRLPDSRIAAFIRGCRDRELLSLRQTNNLRGN